MHLIDQPGRLNMRKLLSVMPWSQLRMRQGGTALMEGKIRSMMILRDYYNNLLFLTELNE